MAKSRIIIVLMVLLSPSSTMARTWLIQEDGSGDATTVQAGIDSAATRDTILVAPGTYFENIDFGGKTIAVRSQSGPEVTTLDGSVNGGAVVLMASDEVDALLEGFMITGGTGHLSVGAGSGGGIYIRACSPIIRGNHFYRNEANPQGIGGGIYIGGPNSINCSLSSPLIENNVFEENHSTNGGAIGLLGGDVLILGNTFIGNSCAYDGAAIFAWSAGGEQVIRGNTFYENEALDHAGGVYVGARLGAISITITSNLFYKNTAWGTGTGDTGSGGAIWSSVSRLNTSFNGLIANNTIVENQGFGESVCSGGGIALDVTPPGLEIRNNIIALNNSCGITCKDNVESVFGPNLLWDNVNGDLGTGAGECPAEWPDIAIIADPYFCDVIGKDYTVAQNSPALTGPEPMGAFLNPGCGPVSVEHTTWGLIKAMYR